MKKNEVKKSKQVKKKDGSLLKKIIVLLLVAGLVGMYVILPIMSAGA